jgi:hypothetical protein
MASNPRQSQGSRAVIQACHTIGIFIEITVWVVYHHLQITVPHVVIYKAVIIAIDSKHQAIAAIAGQKTASGSVGWLFDH